MANAKSMGWTIYAAGVVIWLFSYLSAGHASALNWDVATPWWISSFVPNLEANSDLRSCSQACSRFIRWQAEASVMRGCYDFFSL